MKSVWSVLLVLFLLLGCSSEKKWSSMPNRIDLQFSPVQFIEIQKGEPSPNWEFIKSIPFGRIDNSEAWLDIYEIDEPADNLHNNRDFKHSIRQ